MNSDLLRQRRNLIVISIALLLFKLSETPLEKLLIFGTEFKVSSFYSPQALALLFVFYFLVRYYQYLEAAGDLGIKSHIDSMFRYKILQHYRKAGIDEIMGEIRFQRKGLRWIHSIYHGTSDSVVQTETNVGSLPLLQSWLWRFQAFVHMTMHTPKFTDYILPYLLAVAAVTMTVTRLLR